jgi:hypothetical protein
MNKYLLLILSIYTITISCNKKEPSLPPAEKTGYTVLNNGNAGVDSKTDINDTIPLAIDQGIPSVGNQTYFSNMPIIFFLNDKVLLSSIYENIVVTQENTKVKGTVYVNEAFNGNAIITFTPTDGFLSGKNISVTLKKDIQDDAGNKLGSDYILTYKTKDASTISFDDDKDFERAYQGLSSGVSFIGDGAVMEYKKAAFTAYQGTRYGAISTGTRIVSTGTAIGDATSMMFLGPINTNLSSFTFMYDFISCEFNDFLNSKFDDAAMVTVYGPKGTYSEFINSVKKVGLSGNTQISNFQNLPDGGDAYVGHTGWLKKTISFANVGTPAFIIFTVTDVNDKQLSSVLAVDSLSY